MSENISVRLDKNSKKELEYVMGEWHTDRSEAVRRLLGKALEDWKKEKALENLAKHKISIGKAAEECNLSIWEMINLAKERNIDWAGYSKKELEKEIKILEHATKVRK